MINGLDNQGLDFNDVTRLSLQPFQLLKSLIMPMMIMTSQVRRGY